jgi:hypothetical protein
MVMNSIYIAHELEASYPNLSLDLEVNLHEVVQDADGAVINRIWWGALPTFAPAVLLPRSATYFRETREKMYGGTFEALAEERGGETGWKAAEAPGGPLEGLKDVLIKYRRDAGPFVLGSQPSYGDFEVVGFFGCWERVSTCIGTGDFDRLMMFDDVFVKLHQACRPWLERDD